MRVRPFGNRLLVAAYDDDGFWLVKAPSGEAKRKLLLTEHVRDLCWNSYGNRIAVCHGANITIYDDQLNHIQSRSYVRTTFYDRCGNVESSFPNKVLFVVWIQERLIYGSQSNIYVTDINTNKRRSLVSGPFINPRAALSPSGETLVLVDVGKVWFYDTTTGELKHEHTCMLPHYCAFKSFIDVNWSQTGRFVILTDSLARRFVFDTHHMVCGCRQQTGATSIIGFCNNDKSYVNHGFVRRWSDHDCQFTFNTYHSIQFVFGECLVRKTWGRFYFHHLEDVKRRQRSKRLKHKAQKGFEKAKKMWKEMRGRKQRKATLDYVRELSNIENKIFL